MAATPAAAAVEAAGAGPVDVAPSGLWGAGGKLLAPMPTVSPMAVGHGSTPSSTRAAWMVRERECLLLRYLARAEEGAWHPCACSK